MSMTDRRKKSDFQNKMLARFPDQRVDPIILLLFEELAVRVNAAQVYPPGILDVVACTTADLVNELRELPETEAAPASGLGLTEATVTDYDPTTRTATVTPEHAATLQADRE